MPRPVTPPLLLYEPATDPASQRRSLAPWKGLLHALAVVAAVAVARFALFDMIQWLSSSRPEVRRP